MSSIVRATLISNPTQITTVDHLAHSPAMWIRSIDKGRSCFGSALPPAGFVLVEDGDGDYFLAVGLVHRA